MSVQTPPPAPAPVHPSPVRALPYSADVAEPVAAVALRLVVAVAALVGCLGLIHAASGLWVHFSPVAFSGIGTWPRGTWQAWIGPALLVVAGAGNGLILAGAAAYWARSGRARRLLFWGAAGVVAGTAGLFMMELVGQALGRGASYNLPSAVVLMLWRVQWMMGSVAMPLLLILLLARPEVKRWVAERPRNT